MRLSKRFRILHATTVVAVLAACGVNDRHDADRDAVVVRTYTDVRGDVPPFAGNLGTCYFTDKAGWNVLIHPEAGETPYSETSERVTRVVVHELGHTLREPGKPQSPEQAHGYPAGCYMRDSDASLEGVPPLCPEEAAMAREWVIDHGALRVTVEDGWLREHVERAVAVWNDGAGMAIFTIEE